MEHATSGLVAARSEGKSTNDVTANHTTANPANPEVQIYAARSCIHVTCTRPVPVLERYVMFMNSGIVADLFASKCEMGELRWTKTSDCEYSCVFAISLDHVLL
jgi:hypothetical protein